MDALAEPDRLDALLLQRFMVGESETLQILSTSGTLRSPFLVSRAAVEKLIELTRQMADIVIVDLPHLWAPWVEEVLVDADEIAITTGLDLANLRDARNLVELLRAKRGEGRSPHIVVNRADMAKRGRLTLQDANTALSTKPLAQLPFDPVAFVEAVNDGKVFADRNKKHKATLALQEIAARLTGHEKPKRRVIGFSLQGRFKRPSNTKMAST
jgi:pilus assembly protein CpaE